MAETLSVMTPLRVFSTECFFIVLVTSTLSMVLTWDFEDG